TINGYKTFVSFGDKIGDTSVYLSYNRLESDSQPQIFYYGTPIASASTSVTGGIVGNDELSNERLWFGDTGAVSTVTDNYKLKIGHDFGEWETLLNLAYEDRYGGSDRPNSYIRDAAGNPVWSGNVVQDGMAINIPAARLGGSVLERDSLSVGLRVRGPIADGVNLEARSEEHTSELQSREKLVCRLLL